MTDAPTRPPLGGPSGPRRLAVLLGAVLVAIALASVVATILGGPGRRMETGIVVAVQATSLSSVQGFSIRTPDGRQRGVTIRMSGGPPARPTYTRPR